MARLCKIISARLMSTSVVGMLMTDKTNTRQAGLLIVSAGDSMTTVSNSALFNMIYVVKGTA